MKRLFLFILILACKYISHAQSHLTDTTINEKTLKRTLNSGDFVTQKNINFALPIVYDFGHVSNIQLASDEGEGTISGAINLPSFKRNGSKDCEQCQVNNHFFLRGKLIFPDNQIRKSISIKNYQYELGYRKMLRSNAFYYVVDTEKLYAIKDTCCMFRNCDLWQKNRPFDLRVDFSYATEKWLEFGLIFQNRNYSILEDSNIKKGDFKNISLNVSYNLYRKFNTKTLSESSHRSRLRNLSFVGIKLNTQLGYFDNIKQTGSLYIIDPATLNIVGKTTYGEPVQILSSPPNQGIGIRLFLIAAVGLSKYASIALTPERVQPIINSISQIASTSLRWDLLFKLPKTEDCQRRWTQNISFGINCKYQNGSKPVYGFGANIPFDN